MLEGAATYMTPQHQPELGAHMRVVLFDWMQEVGQEFMLKRETVYYAMHYVDRYLYFVPNVGKARDL